MSAPANQSTWGSGSPLSLWWGARYDNADHYCGSQGLTGIKQAQRTLLSILPAVFTVEWAGGVLQNRGDLVADGKYGPITARALLYQLQGMDVPDAVSSAVASEYSRLTAIDRDGSALGQPLSQETCATLIWIAFHRNLPWAALGFPTMSALRWKTAPPNDAPYDFLSTCWDAASPAPSTPPSNPRGAGSTGTSGTTTTTGNAQNEPAITPAARGLSTPAKVAIGGAVLAAATPEGRKFLRNLFK